MIGAINQEPYEGKKLSYFHTSISLSVIVRLIGSEYYVHVWP